MEDHHQVFGRLSSSAYTHTKLILKVLFFRYAQMHSTVLFHFHVLAQTAYTIV
jgi:hypothetical protein